MGAKDHEPTPKGELRQDEGEGETNMSINYVHFTLSFSLLDLSRQQDVRLICNLYHPRQHTIPTAGIIAYAEVLTPNMSLSPEKPASESKVSGGKTELTIETLTMLETPVAYVKLVPPPHKTDELIFSIKDLTSEARSLVTEIQAIYHGDRPVLPSTVASKLEGQGHYVPKSMVITKRKRSAVETESSNLLRLERIAYKLDEAFIKGQNEDVWNEGQVDLLEVASESVNQAGSCLREIVISNVKSRSIWSKCVPGIATDRDAKQEKLGKDTTKKLDYAFGTREIPKSLKPSPEDAAFQRYSTISRHVTKGGLSSFQGLQTDRLVTCLVETKAALATGSPQVQTSFGAAQTAYPLRHRDGKPVGSRDVLLPEFPCIAVTGHHWTLLLAKEFDAEDRPPPFYCTSSRWIALYPLGTMGSTENLLTTYKLKSALGVLMEYCGTSVRQGFAKVMGDVVNAVEGHGTKRAKKHV